MKIKQLIFLVLFFLFFTQATFAAYYLTTERALLKFDYQVVPITGYPTIDLMGFHYLYGVTRWLYFGIGGYAPLFYGNYGGFLTFDAITQVQYSFTPHFFADAGTAFGGGGGGANVASSEILCPKSRYVNSYAGLGYHFSHLSVGLNYSYFHFFGSPINHAQIDIYIQKSLSYAVGSYKYIDRWVRSLSEIKCDKDCPDASTNVISFELNNLFPNKQKNGFDEPIHLIAFELDHYFSRKRFVFFNGAAGYAGMPGYNQVLFGVGYHIAIFPRVGFSSEFGVGSGGYDPNRIDTHTGLLIYPKFLLEYFFNKKISLSLSGGYLVAPDGNFNAYSVGMGVNYHFFTGGKIPDDIFKNNHWRFGGFRASLFNQTEFDVKHANSSIPNINLISFELDSFVHRYWYIPMQISFAYTNEHGGPGYGEALIGLGVQTKPVLKKQFQYFFQAMAGTDVHGAAVKPQIGVNYGLTDYLAVYGMLARTFSFEKEREIMSSYSVGLGLTYRFSLLDNSRV